MEGTLTARLAPKRDAPAASDSMPGVALPPLPVEPEFCVVSRWNLSLPGRVRWGIFGALATVSLTLALAFVAAGAWMVLPYSVLEMSVLALAFHLVGRRSGDWERLTVCGDRVIVERARGDRHLRREWNRPWVRVEMAAARFGRPAKLVLSCGGETWEFGDALPEHERGEVAKEMRRLTTAGAR
jgi:uncharacterized membrane protein